MDEFLFENYRDPSFGFVFTETREDNVQELAAILQSDLSAFIEL